MIDLSRLRGIRVRPRNARSLGVEAGCTLGGDLDHAAHAFGLALPSGHHVDDRESPD